MLAAINAALDDRVIEAAVGKELARLRAGQAQHLDRRTQVERELSLIEARVRRLAEAIANGGPLDTLVSQLRTEEERKKTLAHELQSLGTVQQVASLDAARITRDLRARVADIKGLLARRKPQARQMLRKVLVDKLELEAVEENGRRGYRFKGEGTLGRLLAGEAFEALPRTVVAPTGPARFRLAIPLRGGVRTRAA